ncbi:hypothetical protein CEXT_423031 [Caerostris extrusa]|uniref:Uncharacterized protein n=1 Tax=Caerostris extrusa TaxID=172846 RepID=A0AAV4R4E5_CAEEX|nr:hypothetical protein CEXT_423031 [Caerostris extrusa]
MSFVVKKMCGDLALPKVPFLKGQSVLNWINLRLILSDIVSEDSYNSPLQVQREGFLCPQICHVIRFHRKGIAIQLHMSSFRTIQVPTLYVMLKLKKRNNGS